MITRRQNVAQRGHAYILRLRDYVRLFSRGRRQTRLATPRLKTVALAALVGRGWRSQVVGSYPVFGLLAGYGDLRPSHLGRQAFDPRLAHLITLRHGDR